MVKDFIESSNYGMIYEYLIDCINACYKDEEESSLSIEQKIKLVYEDACKLDVDIYKATEAFLKGCGLNPKFDIETEKIRAKIKEWFPYLDGEPLASYEENWYANMADFLVRLFVHILPDTFHYRTK